MKERKKIIIIGAGLAGMSAGYYLQRNGFDTEIFEMSACSGGLCASWKRNEYQIDGCIHFMIGTTVKNNPFPFWNDLLDLANIRFLYSDTHAVVEDENQHRVNFYSDANQLEAELLKISKEDAKTIGEFIRGIKKFMKMQLPVTKPVDMMTLTDKLKIAWRLVGFLPALRKYIKLTNEKFAEGIKNPVLRKSFTMAFIPDSTLLSSMLLMVWRHNKQLGYPVGGAVGISGAIEKKYREAGGKIQFNSPVKTVLVKDKNVYGIQLENDEKYFGDIVISAADGRSTIYNMLEGKFKDKKILERYESSLFQPLEKTLYISIGINQDFSHIPYKLYFPIKNIIRTDPMTELEMLEITHYCGDPNAAPEGKSLITSMPDSRDWKYWYDLRENNKEKYYSEKQRIADEVIDALEQRFGNFKAYVEMVDVATPATYFRYTGNWSGGQLSWKATKAIYGKPTAWRILGLTNFYMTGQWAGITGGLNNVVMMGNHLAQIICKKQGVKFAYNFRNF
ncbi:MAG: NAD(P)/FAD-dependent oxidoreductase [Bacteroidia bacterium]|nr:NAD(P)/FAD-dependent oxidoreductase [Bacteroidia bacterium]